MGNNSVDILVIGAGICGIMLARELEKNKHLTYEVWDKGRSVGGRMATRRMSSDGREKADHGAQFFTARDPRTQSEIAKWAEQGWIMHWPDFSPNGIADPNWVAKQGMNQLAKQLAEPCLTHVRTNRQVSKVSVQLGEGFRVEAIDENRNEHVVLAHDVIFTAPVPQALAMCARGDISISPEVIDRLKDIGYAPCIAAMIRCAAPQSWVLPLMQHKQWPRDRGVRFLAENQQKGISVAPVLTVHMDAEWSSAHFERTDLELKALVSEALNVWMNTDQMLDVTIKKWRYAQAVQTINEPFICAELAHSGGRLYFAGDAFGIAGNNRAGRLEHAMLSGWRVADTLVE